MGLSLARRDSNPLGKQKSMKREGPRCLEKNRYLWDTCCGVRTVSHTSSHTESARWERQVREKSLRLFAQHFADSRSPVCYQDHFL